MRSTIFFAALLALPLAAAPFHSPDGRLEADVRLGPDGAPVYELKLEGRSVLRPSRLGLVLEDADYTRGLTLTRESEATAIEDRYELLTAKRRRNTYRANRKAYEFATADGHRLQVVLQLSDDGLGFRYVFPDASETPRAVRSEATSFRLPADTLGWLQPMSVAKTGWARVNPCYEEYYQLGIPAGTPSTLGAGWAFPALFRTGDDWILLTETDLVRGYCATRLAHASPENEYAIAFPDPRETLRDEAVTPRFVAPYATPWRVVVVGSLKTVVESTLGLDLAAPGRPSAVALAGAPGKASWSWPKLGDRRTDYPTQLRFIDFAAERGWTHCLVDAFWDKQIGYDRMKQLADHARGKGVALHVWYNTNGDWNDANQTPKDRMVDREVRRAEFARIREIGIAGVKIDFFPGDGRAVVDFYHDILADAADHGLLVNFHGATLPRGLSRTYPNFMTAEAVKGYEFIVNDQKNADRAPPFMAMLPFARNVFDPMDFTPLCLADLPRVRRRTTVAAELATAVLYTSGIQHYIEIPEGLAKQPDYVRDALREIPTAWEDVRFLAGDPGKYVVLARRGADGRWWIAGFNGEDAPRALDLDLSALGGVDVRDLITDAADGHGFERRSVPASGSALRLELKPRGGFLAVAR